VTTLFNKLFGVIPRHKAGNGAFSFKNQPIKLIDTRLLPVNGNNRQFWAGADNTIIGVELAILYRSGYQDAGNLWQTLMRRRIVHQQQFWPTTGALIIGVLVRDDSAAVDVLM
jgi:hypothetical protein